MPVASATALQRLTLRNEAVKTGDICQEFAQSATNPDATKAAAVDAQLTVLATALSAVGAGAALPATQALVTDGGNVTVKNSAGTVSKVGVATVAANAITGVALAATEAIITNAASVVVQNNGGAQVSASAVATVAAGVVSNVKLPGTAVGIATGTKVNAVSVTGTGNFATFTISGGAITAIVLSAS